MDFNRLQLKKEIKGSFSKRASSYDDKRPVGAILTADFICREYNL